jgi:hypothetical protein
VTVPARKLDLLMKAKKILQLRVKMWKVSTTVTVGKWLKRHKQNSDIAPLFRPRPLLRFVTLQHDMLDAMY